MLANPRSSATAPEAIEDVSHQKSAIAAPVAEAASDAPGSDPLPAAPRKPVGLIVALVLALLGMVAAVAYVQMLMQERDLLQAQLNDEQRKVLDMRERLTRAEVAVEEKDAALASRDVALAEATQPELPVRVSFRPAWMGQGMVASFHNVGNQPLTLMVELRDPDLHTTRDFAFVVEAGATADVGHAQGWLLTSGQSVRVSASGYKSVSAFAP